MWHCGHFNHIAMGSHLKERKKKALLHCHIWNICKYQAVLQKATRKKKNHNMLNFFPKSGFNKDPRGRILGYVKNDGHALNVFDSWGLFSFTK